MSAVHVRSVSDLPLVRTMQLGEMRLHALEAGLQRLDGGAMFGVVPKPLWERRIRADERNRIPLALRCFLVESEGRRVLVETGLGSKENEKFREIYGVENAGDPDAGLPDRLHLALGALGLRPGDIDVVINTHLHFDHAGGNTFRDRDGVVRPAFPGARYVVQRGEWEYAHDTNERTGASYLPDNYDPVEAAGLLERIDGEVEIVPGISVLRTPGHCPHHQSVLIRSGGATACILADVIPTMAHLPLPWIMGYDVEPLRTLESKRALLDRAVHESWLLCSVHDPVAAWGWARAGEKQVEIEPVEGVDTIEPSDTDRSKL